MTRPRPPSSSPLAWAKWLEQVKRHSGAYLSRPVMHALHVRFQNNQSPKEAAQWLNR